MVLKFKRRNKEGKKKENKQGCAVRGIEFIIRWKNRKFTTPIFISIWPLVLPLKDGRRQRRMLVDKEIRLW
jgi:hypothetical protein